MADFELYTHLNTLNCYGQYSNAICSVLLAIVQRWCLTLDGGRMRIGGVTLKGEQRT